jgi:hypothetical protein
MLFGNQSYFFYVGSKKTATLIGQAVWLFALGVSQ